MVAADGTRGGFEALDSCVHCGFCLQACPTFLVTGDEADSPRGRIELMRSLETGRLPPDDPDLARHLDRCLGCRGCEPVCPSGVGYGHGLEAARAVLARARGVPFMARAALWALTTPVVSRIVYALARFARASGVPTLLAGWGRIRFGLGMLAATRPMRKAKFGMRNRRATADSALRIPHSPLSPVLLFRGCVMDGLFSHVHDATIRTLEVNGYAVREAANQVCCGALHAHAGLIDAARALARANVAAFADGESLIATNSAGCGALLKDYGSLLSGEPEARSFSGRVRDVTELLADRGPLAGAPLDARVAYDPPCHLMHAQRVTDAPLRVFAAIPVLRLSTTPGAAQCCGSAGLFTLVEPELSRAVLGPKIDELRAAATEVVATGNPGCAMQIGAGLRAAGVAATTLHPVELLDASYRAAGLYA